MLNFLLYVIKRNPVYPLFVANFVSTLCKSCTNLRYLSMMNNEAAPSYFNGGSYQQYTDYRYGS